LTAVAGAVYDQGQGEGDPTGRPYGVPELLLILKTCHQGSDMGGHCPPIPLINWCVRRILRKNFIRQLFMGLWPTHKA